jgi:hypothetical protein
MYDIVPKPFPFIRLFDLKTAFDYCTTSVVVEQKGKSKILSPLKIHFIVFAFFFFFNGMPPPTHPHR